jgi:proline iminopeptidase
VIVHGRYDVVCPIANAWDLKRAWPIADLVISPTSGHSAFEPETIDALVRATDAYAYEAAYRPGCVRASTSPAHNFRSSS